MAVALGHAAEAQRGDLAPTLATSARQASASPISAIAADSAIETAGRSAISFWIAVCRRTHAVDQVGIGQQRRTRQHHAATSGWSEASALTICGGA